MEEGVRVVTEGPRCKAQSLCSPCVVGVGLWESLTHGKPKNLIGFLTGD